MGERVPVYACFPMAAGRIMGLNSKEFYFDVEKCYEAQKIFIERVGCDDGPSWDIPHGEMLDLGGELHFFDDDLIQLPQLRCYAINSLEEAKEYTLPPVSEMAFLQKRIEFMKYAASKGNKGAYVCGGSPFTMLGSLVEPHLLMKWLVREPEMVNHLLDVVLDYLTIAADEIIREFGAENCSMSTNYPFDSNDLISPKHFEKYALPATLEMHRRMRERGIQGFSIHLCGKQEKTLKYYKELHLPAGSFISADEKNSMTLVRDVLGPDYYYAGNVPTWLFVNGTPEQVYDYSVDVIRKMRGTCAGFALMSSCDLPINSKEENIRALVKAAEEA